MASTPPVGLTAKPSRRAANQLRTSSAPTAPTERAGEHVARMVRRDHDAARR